MFSVRTALQDNSTAMHFPGLTWVVEVFRHWVQGSHLCIVRSTLWVITTITLRTLFRQFPGLCTRNGGWTDSQAMARVSPRGQKATLTTAAISMHFDEHPTSHFRYGSCLETSGARLSTGAKRGLQHIFSSVDCKTLFLPTLRGLLSHPPLALTPTLTTTLR
jgi:hypothetical protein